MPPQTSCNRDAARTESHLSATCSRRGIAYRFPRRVGEAIGDIDVIDGHLLAGLNPVARDRSLEQSYGDVPWIVCGPHCDSSHIEAADCLLKDMAFLYHPLRNSRDTDGR